MIVGAIFLPGNLLRLTVFASGWCLLACVALITGRIYVRGPRRELSRNETPLSYWIVVAMVVLIAGASVFGVIHLAFNI
jgi:hypothetical protein